MPEFGVNLIQTRIPPLEKRQKVFRNMVAYLAICGVALLIVVYAGAQDLLKTVLNRSSLHTMEAAFRDDHPEHRDILAYAADVEGRGQKLTAVLDTVQKSTATRADVAQMLVGITGALPNEIHLLEFALDSNKGMATFDIAAPIVLSNGELTDPGQLVGLWNRDENLAAVLKQIQSVESHRKILDGEPVFVLRFSGTLPGGEG